MSRDHGGDVRVILVTVVGPGGQVDIGVRSDATPADLAWHLGSVIGIGAAGATAEHWSSPRPAGGPALRRAMPPSAPLAEAGVLDGDLVVFTQAAGERGTAAYDLR